jgi:hypothetical protein
LLRARRVGAVKLAVHCAVSKVAVLAVVLGWGAPARAWNPHGHRVVAAFAYRRLRPDVRWKVDALLALHPDHPGWVEGVPPGERSLAAFMRASNWADDLRERPGPAADKHPDWHYVNVPFSLDGTPTRPPALPNVQTQIAELRRRLADPTASDQERSTALVWLLHLVGDVHMPLHCVARFDRSLPHGDRGGTLIRLSSNPHDHLHGFWDRALGDATDLASARGQARRLPAPPPALIAVADESAWVNEGSEAAKRWVYRPPVEAGPGPFVLDARYARDARLLAAERIALAGARLARLLDDALR